jgi:hypothetical protein
MQFDFEKFEGTGGSYFPKVSIRSNGTLGVSQGALNRFRLAEGDWWFQLLFDRKKQVIGLQPIDHEAHGLLKLNKKLMMGRDGKKSVNAWIAAKAFFDFYGIPYDDTKSYEANWDEAGKLIYIELDQPRQSSGPQGTGGGAPA